jgi:hypothetical protein
MNGTYYAGKRAWGAGRACELCGEARELEHLLAEHSLHELAPNPPLSLPLGHVLQLAPGQPLNSPMGNAIFA